VRYIEIEEAGVLNLLASSQGQCIIDRLVHYCTVQLSAGRLQALSVSVCVSQSDRDGVERGSTDGNVPRLTVM